MSQEEINNHNAEMDYFDTMVTWVVKFEVWYKANNHTSVNIFKLFKLGLIVHVSLILKVY